MAGDLLFYILPRLGKVPYKPEPRNVRPVDKDAKFRPLNDEEKELEYMQEQTRVVPIEQDDHPHGLYKDAQGNKHFDDFV